MFSSSTQKKYWLLNGSNKISSLIIQANEKFIQANKQLLSKEGANLTIEYLDLYEEKMFQIYYTHFVYEICRKFKPPVPMSVVGMSVMYFKRFYLNTSVMEFHPKYIAYLCVYLACKVDEYNVSIDQFMSQVVSSPQPFLQMFIIDNELLLIQKLGFHLTIHSPYRPLEGFFIDIKTKQTLAGVDVENFRVKAEKFLANCLLTDAGLLYTPSQIALAALSYAIGQPFNVYIQQLTGESNFQNVLEKLDHVKELIMNFKVVSKDDVIEIANKLSLCQDNEHNPESDLYHRREMVRKEAKEREKQKKYQELYDMQTKEEQVLAQEMTMYDHS